MTKSSEHPRSSEHSVVVVGAGYAGVLAANRILAARDRARGDDPARNCRVTVVNPRAQFVERIRLHQVAAGTRASATLPLPDVLHADAQVIVGEVRSIDADRRCVEVTTADGVVPLGYDTLVYAVGSGTAHSVPGSGEHAHHAGDDAATSALRAALAALAPEAVVRVVGGGATSVEIAAEVAAARPDLAVEIVSADRVLGFMRPRARARIMRTLTGLGVTCREDTRVARVGAHELHTAEGAVLPFDVCVWAAAFGVPDLARRSGLATDAAGRLRVDATLTSVDHPDIVGAGDAVAVAPEVGGHLRMACATAMPLGGHAATTVLARIRGRALPVLSIGFAAQCLSLGRKAGYVQLVRADDSPRPLAAGGRLGATAKEAICRMTVDKLRAERARPGAFHAPKGPAPAARPRIEETSR